MSNIAIYPGSFDPFTNSHLDIVKKGANLFDEVTYENYKGDLEIESRDGEKHRFSMDYDVHGNMWIKLIEDFEYLCSKIASDENTTILMKNEEYIQYKFQNRTYSLEYEEYRDWCDSFFDYDYVKFMCVNKNDPDFKFYTDEVLRIIQMTKRENCNE